MEEIKYRLALLCDALALWGEIAHKLADLAGAAPRLTEEQRRTLAAEVHDLADRIEEME